MKILPPVTLPPRRPITRRHEPRQAQGAGGYQTYRACLRWEFGFTCSFCLTHEADLTGGRSAEGLGVTGVEHGAPQSVAPERSNQYSNCFYACSYCNRARASRPVASLGRRLLDPTRSAWGDHFRRLEDRLLPVEGDEDAAYTHAVYELDDPRKIELRRLRRELLADRLELLRCFPDDLRWLLAEVEKSPPRRAREALDLARRLRLAIHLALEDLAGFAAVPADAPAECRCSRRDHHVLPQDLESQTVELDLGSRPT